MVHKTYQALICPTIVAVWTRVDCFVRDYRSHFYSSVLYGSKKDDTRDCGCAIHLEFGF